MKQYTRKITRVGKRSLSVVIPADIIEDLGWKDRQKVTVKRVGKKVSIKDWEG